MKTFIKDAPIKKYIRSKGFKCSDKCIEALQKIVENACKEAFENAKQNKRKTVLYRDFLRVNKIVDCKPLDDYKIWIRFVDGLEGEIDLKHLVGIGIYAKWNDKDFFQSVYIDPISHTLTWDEDLDLCPDQLRKKLLKLK